MTHDPREAPQITMADIRKHTGEGMVSEQSVIDAANEVLKDIYTSPPPAEGWDEATRYLQKITDLVDDENTCDPLDDAISYANKALEALRREAPAPEGVDRPDDGDGVHLWHCNQGHYLNVCKYGDDDCPALSTPPAAAESNASVEAIELAYGLLWVVGCDRSTRGGNALYLARKALLEQLDRAGQGRGISAARKVLKDEEAGCGDIRYGVLARFSADLDGGVSIWSGDTGACDPASGGVASLHNDGHPEGAARPDGLSVEARLREAILASIDMIDGCHDAPTNPDSLPQMVKVHLQQAITAVGDEAKKSIPVQDAEPASGAHVAGRTGGAHPPTGANPSDPTAERREIVARALMEKWPGDYAWGDETREPNELAFETADAILAALDGGAGA